VIRLSRSIRIQDSDHEPDISFSNVNQLFFVTQTIDLEIRPQFSIVQVTVKRTRLITKRPLWQK